MNKECTIVIKDEVNVRLEGLDVQTRRKISDKLRFFLPYARHTPSYKLGRWDGTVSFCDIGGRTYINLLDELLPIVIGDGYAIQVADHRQPIEIKFDKIDKDSYSHVMWPEGHPLAGQPIVLRDHQVDFVNNLMDSPTGISIASTGAGKAQPLTSKIKVPNGWKQMGDINVGDLVIAPDGSTTKVVGVFPQGSKPIYEFTFSDGRIARATDEHLWKVYNKHWKKRKGNNDGYEVITTTDIIDNMHRNGGLYIPLCEPEECKDVQLPIDPYLLGVLIGDGHIKDEKINFSTADQYIVDEVSTLLHEDYYVKKINTEYDYAIRVKPSEHSRLRKAQGFHQKPWHYLRVALTELGLYGTDCFTKFIPSVYKHASPMQKYRLIQGLMDTDGSAEKNCTNTFCTTSERLADDFREILQSVGAIVKKVEKIPTYIHNGEKKKGSRCYILRIKCNDPTKLFNLPRKSTRTENYQHAGNVRLKIESVKYVGDEPAQCIMVDHPEHLYITDNYVVTHNTIGTAILSDKAGAYGRSVVIVPTKDLVVQTEEDYINLGLDVGVYYGDRKDYDKQHTICTWQSLEALNKRKDGVIDEMLDGVVCVIVDEVHKAKADVLRKLLSGPFGNVPIRWGLTGTLPEEDHEQVAVLACIGDVTGEVRAKELQEKGILADLHINILQLKDHDGQFGNYQSELAWLMTNTTRIDHISEMISDIAMTGNTLVLVDRVKTGEMIRDNIDGSVFISGSVKSAARKEEYKSVQFEDNKTIIATYGVASTGININRIFNLVLIEPGKSFVRVIQSIGRGLRVAEDKDFVNVYDITSTCKYAKRHLTKRKKHYKEAEYPFSIKKVEY